MMPGSDAVTHSSDTVQCQLTVTDLPAPVCSDLNTMKFSMKVILLVALGIATAMVDGVTGVPETQTHNPTSCKDRYCCTTDKTACLVIGGFAGTPEGNWECCHGNDIDDSGPVYQTCGNHCEEVPGGGANE